MWIALATPFAVLGFMLFMPGLEKWAVRPDGSVVVWYGARKASGRGEGSGGRVDQISPTDS